MTIQELATKALAYFTHQDRNGKDIVLVSDDAPEWVDALSEAAHKTTGNETLLPDDWRYSFVADALSCLSDDVEMDLDGLYPYTHDRLNWFASRLDRYAYCNEAIEESGAHVTDVMQAVAMGMFHEMSEVMERVRFFLEERIEEFDVTEGEDV